MSNGFQFSNRLQGLDSGLLDDLSGFLGGLDADVLSSFGSTIQVPELRRLARGGTLVQAQTDFLNNLLEQVSPAQRNVFDPANPRFGEGLRGLGDEALAPFLGLLGRRPNLLNQIIGRTLQAPDLRRILGSGRAGRGGNAIIRDLLAALAAAQGGGGGGGGGDERTGGQGDTGTDQTHVDTSIGGPHEGGFHFGSSTGGETPFEFLPPEVRQPFINAILSGLNAEGLPPELLNALQNQVRGQGRLAIQEGTRDVEENLARRGLFRSGRTQRDVERLRNAVGSQVQQGITAVNAQDIAQRNANLDRAFAGVRSLANITGQELELGVRENLALLGLDLDAMQLELARELGFENIRLDEMRLAMERALQEILVNRDTGILGLFPPGDSGGGGGPSIEDILAGLLPDRPDFGDILN